MSTLALSGNKYQGRSYSSRLISPSSRTAPVTGYTRTRSLRRLGANLLIMFSVLAILVFANGGIKMQDAKANWFSDAIKSTLCGPEAYFNAPEAYTSGLVGLGFGPSVQAIKAGQTVFQNGDPNWNATKHTAYERYGMSGANWTVYRGKESKDDLNTKTTSPNIKGDDDIRLVGETSRCYPIPDILGTYFANQIFTVTKIFTVIAGFTYSAALGGEFIDKMNDTVGNVITGGSDPSKGLRQVLYFDFLNLVIMLGALYLAWIGLVKRQSTDAGQKALWMVGSVIIGSIMLYHPTGILDGANTVVKTFTGSIMNSTTSVAITTTTANANNGGRGTADLCAISGSITTGNNTSRVVECNLWRAFVYTPWATGQFGTSPSTDLGTGAPNVNLGAGTNISNWQLYQLDQQSLDVESAAKADKMATITEKYNNWFKVRDQIAEKNTGVWTSWDGEQSAQRMSIAMLSLITSACGLALIIFLSASMLVYQVGTTILVFVSPLFLLAGAHPGMGRGIALRWAELLVSTILKRILIAALLGIMMSFYMLVLNNSLDLSYGSAMLLVIIISFAGLTYRKQLIDAFTNVSFGGTTSGLENTPHRFRQGGAIAAGAGMGLLTGGIGGIAAAASGAGIKAGAKAAVRTAAKSTVSGARTGATSMSASAAAIRVGSGAVRTAKGAIGDAQQSRAKDDGRKFQKKVEADHVEAHRDNNTFDKSTRETEARRVEEVKKINDSIAQYHKDEEKYQKDLAAYVTEFNKQKKEYDAKEDAKVTAAWRGGTKYEKQKFFSLTKAPKPPTKPSVLVQREAFANVPAPDPSARVGNVPVPVTEQVRIDEERRQERELKQAEYQRQNRPPIPNSQRRPNRPR